MAAQTSYQISQDSAYAGQIYGQGARSVFSRSVETTEGIPFGVAVSRGTDPDNQVVLGGTDFVGITVRSLDFEGAVNTGDIFYKENDTAAIMRRGAVWVICPSGCVAGDQVKFTRSTGVLDSTDIAAGDSLVFRAYWDSTAAAGDLAVIVIETTEVSVF